MDTFVAFLQTAFSDTILLALVVFPIHGFLEIPGPFLRFSPLLHVLTVLNKSRNLSTTVPCSSHYFQSQWQCVNVCNLCQEGHSIVCSPGINRTIPSFKSCITLYKGGQRHFSLCLPWTGPHPVVLHILAGGLSSKYFFPRNSISEEESCLSSRLH